MCRRRICVLPGWSLRLRRGGAGGGETTFKRDLLRASKGRSARHALNYDFINGHDPRAQGSSVWCIRTVPESERLADTPPPGNPRSSCGVP